MSEVAEAILGVIPVTFPRRIGFERLTLYVTGRRIIVAHESKKGPGALVLAPLLGRLSGVSDDSSRDRKRPPGKSKLESLNPESILMAHRDNFTLAYDELVSVELGRTSDAVSITILTREDKFQFSSNLELREILELLSPNLGAKLKT